MDIEKIINGEKRLYCIPASQYVAENVAKESSDEYEYEVTYNGTGAILKKYSKIKHTDFYDKDHFYYTKRMPPILIGAFYWEADKDIAVFSKICTDEENSILQKTEELIIPYDVFKHLREDDLIEIKGIIKDKTGKKNYIKFRACKKFIIGSGKREERPKDMPIYLVSKNNFARSRWVNKTVAKKRNCKRAGG